MESSFFRPRVEEAFKKLDALSGQADIDISDDRAVVSLKNLPALVFYRHDVMEQIWVTSYLTGAHHFMYDEPSESWQHTRRKVSIKKFIEEEMVQAKKISF